MDDLATALDEDFSWRIKELHTFRSDVLDAKGGTKPCRIRAGVALLYAHWEGFVKQASILYLSYVATRGPRLEQLCPGLLALALKGHLQDFHSNNDVEKQIELVELFRTRLSDAAKLPHDTINTGGNLNSERIKKIILTLGLDYSKYELKENLLDTQLLRLRNNIAHGRGGYPSEEEFVALFTSVLELLRDFKDQVGNAAALKKYEALEEKTVAAA